MSQSLPAPRWLTLRLDGAEAVDVEAPVTRCAKSDDVHIAYQVLGSGPLDVVVVPGFVSHLELDWQNPVTARLRSRLTSFVRVVVFDKRGTGMSDRVSGPGPAARAAHGRRPCRHGRRRGRAGGAQGPVGGRSDGRPLRGHLPGPPHRLKGVPDDWRVFAVVR
jgi:hypothetical protein